jgi:protein TonB
MAPAAPRAVLNSIAPSATAALAPALVRPLEPPAVPVIDEPDEVVESRIVDTAEVLDAPFAKTRGPQRTLHARESQVSPLAMAVARQAHMKITRARRRDVVEKPLPPRLSALAPGNAKISSEATSRPPVAHAAARESVQGDPGSVSEARASSAVAGQPGADRRALPAAGNEPPDYPWSARVHGHQGRVVLSVWVGAGGEAERLSVLQSSGYASLDRAAVKAVERWQFQPARRGGHDTGSLLYVPVVFRLDE